MMLNKEKMSETEEEKRLRLEKEKKAASGSATANPGFNAFAARLKKRMEKKEYNPKSMTSAPTAEQVFNFNFKNIALDIASPEELTLISELWSSKLGLPAEANMETAMEIAWICYNNGSSANMNIKGKSSYGKELSELIGAIREVCPLRQFCRAYANLVWAKAINENTPPIHWVKAAYKEEVKFAAFDFFDAVGSEGAIQPPTGLPRFPTEQERNANVSRKKIAVTDAAKRNGNNTIQSFEITGGRSGIKPDLSRPQSKS